ncbi:MAG: hypothetical protein AAF092_09970 [Pseudomonadota bacterium]
MSDADFNDRLVLNCSTTPPELNEFLATYRVARTVPGESARRLFWSEVRAAVKSWNQLDSILEKAQSLTRHVSAIPFEGKERMSKRLPFSAATKLGWFLANDNWTLFDSRANKTLGAQGFMHFYEVTHRLGFSRWCVRTKELFAKAGEQVLSPERTWDKLLYLLGGELNPGTKKISVAPHDLILGDKIANAEASAALQAYLEVRLGVCRAQK